jgi:hypothetical protein
MLEGDLINAKIHLTTMSMISKLQKIEMKLFKINGIKDQISSDDMQLFEMIRKNYIVTKQRLDDIVSEELILSPGSTNNRWKY